MAVAGIDVPCLGEGQQAWGEDWPESFLRYEAAFAENLAIDDSNVKQVTESTDPENPDDAFLEDSKTFLDGLVQIKEDGPSELQTTDGTPEQT